MLNMSENTSNQKKLCFNETKNQHARTFIYFQMLQLDSLCVNGFNGTLSRVFFSPQFCKVGNHPQEDLTHFGYKSKRALEKFRIHAMFWQHARTFVQTCWF